MLVLQPQDITDTVLVSSTVPENDYAAWNAATSYTVGTRVIRPNHKIYENLIAGVNATLPELATTGTTPRWLDCKYVNRWRMFDQSTSTVTSATGSLSVVLSPVGFPSGLTFQRLTGKSLHVGMVAGGLTVFDKTYILDGTIITTLSDYFFAEALQKESIVIVDLPPYASAQITATLTGASGSTVSCGVCQVGSTKYAGRVQKKSRMDFDDYSTINTDTVFGTVELVPRENIDRLDLDVLIENGFLEAFLRLMRSINGKPCVFIPSTDEAFFFLSTFGFRDSMRLAFDTKISSTYNITVRSFI